MLLLSPKLLKYIKAGITFGSVLHGHPFVWRNGKPKLTKNTNQLRIWYFNVVVTIVYYIFLIIRCYQVHRWTVEEGASKAVKIYTQFMVVYYTLPLLFQISLLLHKNDFPGFVSGYLNFFRQVEVSTKNDPDEDEGVDGVERTKMMKQIEMVCDSIWYTFNMTILNIVVAVLINPKSPEFLSSIWPSLEEPWRTVLIIVAAIAQGHILTIYIGNGFLWMLIDFAFLLPALTILQKIKSDLSSKRVSREMVTEGIKQYKSVQIALIAYNKIFCSFLLPCLKLLLIWFCVYCTYGGLRFRGMIIMVMGIVGCNGISVLLLILFYLSGFHKFSTIILRLMREARVQLILSPEQRKTLKSIATLKVKMAGAYYVDRSLILTVICIIIDNTITFLIANPH